MVKNKRSIKRYIIKLTSDENIKAQLSLSFAIPMNLIFGMVQLYSAILNNSVWYYTLSAYYILLAVVRSVLLRYAQAYRLGFNVITESKYYRFSGIMLLIMDLTVGTIVSCIVLMDMGFTHPPIITVAVAVGTFTAIVFALRNLLVYHNYRTPVMSASMVISFVTVLMAFLSMETALIASFGQGLTMTAKRVITAITGGTVCIAILAISIYMIVRSTRYIKSERALALEAKEET